MLEKIKDLFAKKTKVEIVEDAEKNSAAELGKKREVKKIDEVRAKLAFSTLKSVISSKRKIENEEKLKNLFPRKIEDFKAVALDQKTEVNYAMDGMADYLHNTQNCYVLKQEILDRMNDYFIGWSACAVLSQNWLISRALTIPAEDAIASGFKFAFDESDEIVYADEENKEEVEKQQEENEKFLKDILKDAEDYNIAEVCKRANFIKKTFGYCLVIPVIEDADMSKPFNIDGIRKGKYKGMSVIEPMWITPQFDENSRNPMNKDFYEPSSYIIAGSAGKIIHKSWCIKLINAPVPDILKPAYYFGGVPLTQMIYQRVYCAEGVANEAPMLAKTKRTMYMTGDLENAIANPELFAKRMETFMEMKDNFAVAFVPEDTNIGQLETTLTDLDQTIMTQYQLVSSIAQMPVTKLLKVQIRGFDSSGAYEQDDYNQSLVAIQNNDYKPIIKFHNQLLLKSKYQKEAIINIVFGEIDSPSAEENARIRLIDAQRDSVLINAGIISADEVRNKLRNDENSLYTSIPEERIDVEENEEDFFKDIDKDKNNDNPDYEDNITDKNNEEIEVVEEVKKNKMSEFVE